MGSINAQIGKIAGLQIAERGGRRLKAALVEGQTKCIREPIR